MAKIQKAIVVAVVKNSKGKILIAQRKDPETLKADGKWEFVGGHIEFGENPEAAVIREVKEESGLKVKVVRLLPKIYSSIWGRTDGDQWHTLLLCYECRVIGGRLHTKKFDKKIQALKFIEINELKNYNKLAKVDEITTLLNC